jgi:hypothetical protein
MNEAAARVHYQSGPRPERETRYISFQIEIAGAWLVVLMLSLAALPWLIDTYRADTVDRWRAERLRYLMVEVGAQLAPDIDLSAPGGFRDRAAALRLLDRALATDPSIRSIELYDGQRQQHLSTDRGSLGALMPPRWQAVAGQSISGQWVASQAGERDYALGLALTDRQGNFAGYMVLAATKPSSYETSRFRTGALYLALGVVLFAALVATLVVIAPYARHVASEEGMIELVGEEAPDEFEDTAPKQARGVVARIRKRLKAALGLLGAEAGAG